jgi:hypothetical protein
VIPAADFSTDARHAVPTTTYVLAAGDGRLAHVLEDFREPQTADLDGDGLPDLYGLSPRGYSSVNKLCAVGGSSPEVWRWLGGWKPARQDFDGDGVMDPIRVMDRDVRTTTGSRDPRQAAAISARDGHLLWVQASGSGRESATYDKGVPTPAETRDAQGRLLEHTPRDPADQPGKLSFAFPLERTPRGLAGRIGDVRWRCEGPGTPEGLLFSDDLREPPRVVFHVPAWEGGDLYTVCCRALATRPTGEYEPPAGAPRAYDPLPEDPRFIRPLPWMRELPGAIDDEALVPLSIAVVALAGIFLSWGYLALKRSWRKLGVWLAGSILITLALAVPTLWYDASGMDPATRYSWEGWYWIWLAGVLIVSALVVLGLLLRAAYRLLRRGLRRLLASPEPA